MAVGYVVGLLALVVLDRVLVGGLDLVYEERGSSGCESLTAASQDDFLGVARWIQVAFVCWTLLGSAALFTRVVRPAPPARPHPGVVAMWLTSSVACVITAVVAPVESLFARFLVLLVALPVAAIATLLVFMYAWANPVRDRAPAGRASLRVLGWALAVVLAAVLMRSSGEVPLC
jgi:hypothetical protein